MQHNNLKYLPLEEAIVEVEIFSTSTSSGKIKHNLLMKKIFLAKKKKISIYQFDHPTY
jgi:hypothetical protein